MNTNAYGFLMKSFYSDMMRGLSPLYPSGTMNAAAPKQGTPAADWRLFKKTHCPPCLGEALRLGSFIESTIFMVPPSRHGPYSGHTRSDREKNEVKKIDPYIISHHYQ
jgi:hypothetical protein